jgi:alpha-mannosidase
VNGDNLVVSALKKAERDDSVILRFFEIQGNPAETTVNFLGEPRVVREVNLIEDAASSTNHRTVAVKPYEIKTLELKVRP